MRDKTPWYIYPPEEPTKRRGDDPLALLVGFLLALIFLAVALDHALFYAGTAVTEWWGLIGQ